MFSTDFFKIKCKLFVGNCRLWYSICVMNKYLLCAALFHFMSAYPVRCPAAWCFQTVAHALLYLHTWLPAELRKQLCNLYVKWLEFWLEIIFTLLFPHKTESKIIFLNYTLPFVNNIYKIVFLFFSYTRKCAEYRKTED